MTDPLAWRSFKKPLFSSSEPSQTRILDGWQSFTFSSMYSRTLCGKSAKLYIGGGRRSWSNDCTSWWFPPFSVWFACNASRPQFPPRLKIIQVRLTLWSSNSSSPNLVQGLLFNSDADHFDAVRFDLKGKIFPILSFYSSTAIKKRAINLRSYCSSRLCEPFSTRLVCFVCVFWKKVNLENLFQNFSFT